jgi:molecular chaperone GrpE (heat shock protein)
MHEAVSTIAAHDIEPSTVAREVRRGGRLGDDLRRPAQVMVAIAPEPATPWQ